jgi:hypothetical protein
MRTVFDWTQLINSRLSQNEQEELWGKYTLRHASSLPNHGEIVELKGNIKLDRYGTILAGSTAVFKGISLVDSGEVRLEMVDIKWEHGQGLSPLPIGHHLDVTAPRWVV